MKSMREYGFLARVAIVLKEENTRKKKARQNNYFGNALQIYQN